MPGSINVQIEILCLKWIIIVLVDTNIAGVFSCVVYLIETLFLLSSTLCNLLRPELEKYLIWEDYFALLKHPNLWQGIFLNNRMHAK